MLVVPMVLVVLRTMVCMPGDSGRNMKYQPLATTGCQLVVMQGSRGRLQARVALQGENVLRDVVVVQRKRATPGAGTLPETCSFPNGTACGRGEASIAVKAAYDRYPGQA